MKANTAQAILQLQDQYTMLNPDRMRCLAWLSIQEHSRSVHYDVRGTTVTRMSRIRSIDENSYLSVQLNDR